MNNGNGLNAASTKPLRWNPGNDEQATLVKVSQKEVLDHHWPWVRDRLAIIKKKDKSVDGWQPDHIRIAISEGLAGRSPIELWFGLDADNVIVGFIVTNMRFDPYIQLPVAWVVWLAWANKELLHKLAPAFKEIARQRYYPAIEFITGRRGWIHPKKAAEMGFEIKCITYRMELT